MEVSAQKRIDEKSRGRFFIRGRTLNGKSGGHRSKLRNLRTQLVNLLQKKPSRRGMNMDDVMSDSGAASPFWVSRWMDLTKKYGFGYELCDGTLGVLYNDTTELIMLPNGKDLLYIDKAGSEFWYSTEKYPTDLEKKVKLVNFFEGYMDRHLVKTGTAASPPPESDPPQMRPYLQAWNRAKSATLMSLTNGTFQVNFRDHTKLVMCPETSAVTFHDGKGVVRTFRFASLERSGCSEELVGRLKYALVKLTRMMGNEVAQ